MEKCDVFLSKGGYGRDIPCISSGKYRIWGIMSQTHPVSEEFSEIHCCYFAPKEKFTSELPVDTHLVYTIDVF